MDITQQPYKHLKLDKFVYGSKQKIIKTTTQVINRDQDQILNYEGNKKNVYYFSDIDNNLIDFHQINFDYINNKQGKISINSYIDRYNPSFSISANIIKYYNTEQDGQRIAYFPEYIYTPLDITQFKNSCYFLLPISTNKFVNIAHPDKILNDIEKFDKFPISTSISSYIEPHKQFFDRAAYTSEDNCIPVYDMNFKDLQTIKFPSVNDLYSWLIKWGLHNVIYQVYVKVDEEETQETTSTDTAQDTTTDQIPQGTEVEGSGTEPTPISVHEESSEQDNQETTTTDESDYIVQYHSLINEILFDSSQSMSFTLLNERELSTQGCDSILLQPFINYLTSHRYLYSRETFNAMLSELFANISTASMQRYFRLAGRINELDEYLNTPPSSNEIINGYTNIKEELNEQGVYNVYDLLTKKQDITFTPNVLPQNTLLIDNMNERIVYNEDKPVREYLPSCYINFVNLKNSRDPEYQLKCTIYKNENKFRVQNNIFLNDYRFSVSANNVFNSSDCLDLVNRQRTYQITNKAIQYDNNLINDAGYVNLFPQRMSVKQQYYLNQYNDKHICDNTLSSIGTLNGLRNYLQVGTSFSKKVWLSYSYNEKIGDNIFDMDEDIDYIKNNSIDNLPAKTYPLPFYAYSLDRDSHWTKDYNGNNKTTCIMKSYGTGCPWNTAFSGMQSIIGCKLSEQKQCQGFCTFPINNQIKQPFNDNKGLNWNLNSYYELHRGVEDVKAKMNNGAKLTNNYQWLIIPASDVEQIIIADTDITINDDLQVFFIDSNKLSSNASFNDVVSNLTPQQEFKSIFQGFWNDGKSPEFRYTDSTYEIASNSKFNGPHIITKDTIITGIVADTLSCSKFIPSGMCCLMRVKSWWSDTIRCEGSIKIVENNDSILSSNVSKYDFVQTIDGFFKFKQTGLHKSNIYSINLKNTGLSKSEDKEVKMYTKAEAVKLLQDKYFIRYYQDEDSFLVNSDENTFIHAIFGSLDNTVYKRTPLFKEIENTSLSGFALNYITIPFDILIQYEGMKLLQEKQLYYYEKEYNEAQEYNSVRQNIRQLIQRAIRKSITRYMPADTNLWKVEYQDED